MSRSRKKNEYRKSRRFDPSCRCNGSCGWCQQGRFARFLRHLDPGDRLRDSPAGRMHDGHNNERYQQERLIALARKHPAPQIWWDDTDNPFLGAEPLRLEGSMGGFTPWGAGCGSP